MSNFKKMVIGFISIIILIPLIAFGYLYFKLNSMYVPDEVKGSSESTSDKVSKDITNILLLGIDGVNIDKGNRSDSMMILTVDKIHKSIKLTSLARDTYVDIPGYSTEKLTHAYAYEGPSLLIETIKENFGISIDHYVAVNFNSFIKVVDLIGGVDVEVTENDLDILNGTIADCYNYDNNPDKGPMELVKGTGIQNLNGYQALAFSRIRYQDDAYARDSRQREVVQAAINKLMNLGPTHYMDLLDIGIRSTKTNMNPMDIMKLATDAVMIKDTDIAQMEFPVYKDGKTIEGKGWVIQWDKESNLEILNNFIFEDKQHEVQ